MAEGSGSPLNATYDTDSDGQIENAKVDGLVNLAASDTFSGYPISLGSDTDEQLTGDLTDDQANTIYDYSAQNIPAAILATISASKISDVSADSAASAHHTAHEHPGDQSATADITDDQANTIWDYTNQEVPSGSIATISASKISDVSADSVSGAHHTAPATILNTQNPSGVSSVDFNSNIDSTYDIYRIVLRNVIPATNTVDVYLRVNNGTAWQSGASDYAYWVDTGGGSNSSSGDDKIVSTYSGANTSVGSGSGEPGVSGVIEMYDPADSNIYTQVRVAFSYFDSNSNVIGITGAGAYQTAESVSGIRFLFDSGNVESGWLQLRGVT